MNAFIETKLPVRETATAVSDGGPVVVERPVERAQGGGGVGKLVTGDRRAKAGSRSVSSAIVAFSAAPVFLIEHRTMEKREFENRCLTLVVSGSDAIWCQCYKIRN